MASATGLIGEYLHTLDDKGRLAFPVRFREALGPRFVIARGLDPCLYAYSLEEWSAVFEKVRNLPLTQSESRAFVRYFLSGAVEVVPDKQGRILLPAQLREYAGCTKEVWILGVGTRVEIWDKATWDTMKAELGKTFSKLAESIAGI